MRISNLFTRTQRMLPPRPITTNAATMIPQSRALKYLSEYSPNITSRLYAAVPLATDIATSTEHIKPDYRDEGPIQACFYGALILATVHKMLPLITGVPNDKGLSRFTTGAFCALVVGFVSPFWGPPAYFLAFGSSIVGLGIELASRHDARAYEKLQSAMKDLPTDEQSTSIDSENK